MNSTKELLRAKRDGMEWTDAAMRHFIEGMVNGTVSHAQVGAFLMAACIHGLTTHETATLTNVMAASGVTLPTSVSTRPRVDKHSTGGVGDKVSLLLAPLAASCGLDVPMISGRGLGHTGGTLDKLESIVGFRTNLTIDAMTDGLRHDGFFMAGQTPDLAPADRIMYALRDATGTVENRGLITASILSKKIAEGLNGLVMDMKVGRAAFMTSFDEARRLAESMLSVCRAIGLPVRFVFTRMDRPLGAAVGNWVEVVEAEAALASRARRDLAEVTVELVAHMLCTGGLAHSMDEARRRVLDAWRSGAAHVAFHHMVRRQGGNWSASMETYAAHPPRVITADNDGVMPDIDGRDLALIVNSNGAGRQKETDTIDPLAGIVLLAPPGTELRRGEEIAYVHASDVARRDAIATLATALLKTTTAPVEPEPSMILDVWEGA